MKTCKKCNETKDIFLFGKDKNSKGGFRNECIDCLKKIYKDYQEKNKDKIRIKKKLWHYENKSENNQKSKEYYKINIDEIKKKKKEYYNNNKEKSRERKRRYYGKQKSDPIFKIKESIRSIIRLSLYKNKTTKKLSSNEILGCTYEEFKIYIENKFESWMNWSNRGIYNGKFNYGWDIDHIIPISSAKTEEEIIKLNHYTNLQPLCSKMNRDIKRNKMKNMILSRERKYKGFINVDELTIKTRSGKEVKREVMVRKDAVAGIVYNTVKNTFLFVSQYRPGTNQEIVEIVAGTLDIPGEDPREAMAREIDEEIGYKTDTIHLIDECYMSPGGTTEVISIYYCEVSEQIHEGGGLENEDIDVVEMDLEEVLSTRFKDAKTIIGVNYIKQNKGKFTIRNASESYITHDKK